jgi:hypothetical protein
VGRTGRRVLAGETLSNVNPQRTAHAYSYRRAGAAQRAGGGGGSRGTVEQLGPLPRSCMAPAGRPALAGGRGVAVRGLAGLDSLDSCGFNVHDHGGSVSQRSAEPHSAPFLPTGTKPHQ